LPDLAVKQKNCWALAFGLGRLGHGAENNSEQSGKVVSDTRWAEQLIYVKNALV